jgi:hypothetical protein
MVLFFEVSGDGSYCNYRRQNRTSTGRLVVGARGYDGEAHLC